MLVYLPKQHTGARKRPQFKRALFDMSQSKAKHIYQRLKLCTFLLAFLLRQTSGLNQCLGCTSLDSLTFDKFVNKFKVSIIKIDVPYPYGDKQVSPGKQVESSET
jgi:hypothetical protein